MSSNETKQENKNWFVNSDGDITDGDALIAEPNYLSRDGHKNARLISAAPELLAACELAIKETHSLVVHQALKEVITKARGV